MCFYLYACSESNLHTRIGPLKLTGPDGILATYIQSLDTSEVTLDWELLPDEIARLSEQYESGTRYAAVLDMLPKSRNEVCLYRVVCIRGTSREDETDLVLACDPLHEALYNPQERECFTPAPGGRQRQLLEAMRLTGGTAGGQYLWARPKMDIGAAVCSPGLSAVSPDAP